MTTSAMELLYNCALITQYTICSRFNSWVAEASFYSLENKRLAEHRTLVPDS